MLLYHGCGVGEASDWYEMMGMAIVLCECRGGRPLAVSDTCSKRIDTGLGPIFRVKGEKITENLVLPRFGRARWSRNRAHPALGALGLSDMCENILSRAGPPEFE